MSATRSAGVDHKAAAATPRWMASTPVRWMLMAVAGLMLLSLVRIVTGVDGIASGGALRAAIISSVPIALAGLGGLWCERAGVVNIGLEGMMIAGTLGAGYFTYHYGVGVGLLGAVLFGAIGGLIHAYATVIIGVDHIVSGVAINIIAVGVAGFLAEAFFTGLPGGGPTQSPTLPRTPTITIDPVVEFAKEIEEKHWFFVSDFFSVVAALTDRMSVVTLLVFVLFAFTAWILWHTSFGLRLRSVGESPSAAESLGVNVYLYKVIAVTISGMFAGLGGAYLAMVASSGYQNGMTGGLGYIGLAAMIFGNWRPGGLLLGAGLFGYSTALELRGGSESVHALLLLVGVVLLILAVVQIRRTGVAPRSIVFAVLGALFIGWWALTDRIPPDFSSMTPYVATLFVLAFASQSLRMPATAGMVYRKGSAG